MRRWLLAALWAGLTHGAQAADLPDFSRPVLRGPLSTSVVNWQGAYVGGQIGYTGSNMDFSHATTSLTDFLAQNLSFRSTVSGFTLLGKAGPTSGSFGGFVGWNSQWDDVVLGIEGNYSRLSNLSASTENRLPFIAVSGGCFVPPPGDTDSCSVQLSGAATAKVTDVLTLRGRAGWAIDNFLPYMFGGLALGRANISRSVTITERNQFFSASDPFAPDGAPIFTSFNKAENTNVFTYGATAGLGLEARLSAHLFARGEYEYVKFVTTKNIDINMNSVRAAVGYKF